MYFYFTPSPSLLSYEKIKKLPLKILKRAVE
jgi:hypothetical protein